MKRKDLPEIISSLDGDIIEEASVKRAEKSIKSEGKDVKGGSTKSRAAVAAAAAAAAVAVLSVSLIPILSNRESKTPPAVTETVVAATESQKTEPPEESSIGHAGTDRQTEKSFETETACVQTDTYQPASDTETTVETEASVSTTSTEPPVPYVEPVVLDFASALAGGKYVSSSLFPYDALPSDVPIGERTRYRYYELINLPEGYTKGKSKYDSNSYEKTEYAGAGTFYACIGNSVSSVAAVLNNTLEPILYGTVPVTNAFYRDLGDNRSCITVETDNGLFCRLTSSSDAGGNIEWMYIEKPYIYGTGAYLLRFDLEMPCAFIVSDGGPSLEELLEIGLGIIPGYESMTGFDYVADGGDYMGLEFPSVAELARALNTRSILNYGTRGQLSFEYLDNVDPDRIMELSGLPEGTRVMGVEWSRGSTYMVYYLDPDRNVISFLAGVDKDKALYASGNSYIDTLSANCVEKKEFVGESGETEYVYIRTNSDVDFYNFKSEVPFRISFAIS
ncbi:MAG: hypothetical protein J5940_04590, partial [Clostridia bacterium]|nr:hypothetical protein [Clostridia bacterium]